MDSDSTSGGSSPWLQPTRLYELQRRRAFYEARQKYVLGGVGWEASRRRAFEFRSQISELISSLYARSARLRSTLSEIDGFDSRASLAYLTAVPLLLPAVVTIHG
jgi:hypothetical protein